jgi:uncharacterized membrane protein (UPF0127 family)
MGTGYIRNDSVNNIADGNIINASDLDGEFDSLQSAFNASTGHNHDGANNGSPVTKVGPAQDLVVSTGAVTPKTDDTVDLGSATFQFKDAYIDGTAYIDTLEINGTVITPTGIELNYVDGVTSAIQTQLDNKQPLDAQLTDIAGLSPTDNGIIIGNGTNFVIETGATARTSLGLAIGTDVQAYDADLTTLGAGGPSARSFLGLAIGTDVQAYDAQLADIAGLTPTDNNFIVGNGTNFVGESGATARTSLGLGSIATQDASNVTISGGSITGITDLAIADGGTGASTANAAINNLLPSQASANGKYLKSDGTNTSWDDLNISTADITGTLPIANGGTGATSASAARTALGLAIGTDVQGYDPQLADVAGLTPTDNGVIIGDGTNFVIESGNTLRTSLGLAIGTDVQGYDAQLADIAGLTPTDNGVIVGNGTNFVLETGNTLRTSLGLAIGTDVQGYDAQLADIAGLTPTDNAVIIGNGTNFVAESGATLKTSLGLTIGTDIQAYDSNLTSFVGAFTLPTTDGTSGQVLQTNGSGTLSFADVNADPAGTAVALAIALG